MHRGNDLGGQTQRLNDRRDLFAFVDCLVKTVFLRQRGQIITDLVDNIGRFFVAAVISSFSC